MQDRIATAEHIVALAQAYLGLGLGLALVLTVFVLPRVDAGARFDRGAPVGSVLFRLLVVPALALLWPVALVRAIWLLRAASRGGGSA